MTDVLAPVAGTVHPLADVPDPVFSAELVGSGVAVEPDDGPQDAVAPLDGTIVKLHPHAYVVLGDGGTGVLVHLGIDTVQLQGEGFTLVATEGARVSAGDPVVRWDPAVVTAGGRSAVVPVVVMDTAPGAVSSDVQGTHVATGDRLFGAS